MSQHKANSFAVNSMSSYDTPTTYYYLVASDYSSAKVNVKIPAIFLFTYFASERMLAYLYTTHITWFRNSVTEIGGIFGTGITAEATVKNMFFWCLELQPSEPYRE
jgi:hypothetical protein